MTPETAATVQCFVKRTKRFTRSKRDARNGRNVHRLTKQRNVSAVPNVMLRTVETCESFDKLEQRFCRSKRCLDWPNVYLLREKGETLRPVQGYCLERLKRFHVFANLSNVSAVPSVTLATAETFECLGETVKLFPSSNAWTG